MKYYTPAELRKELNISAATLVRYRKAGHITPDFVTPGGHHRYSEETINKFKKNNSIQPDIEGIL